MATVIVPLSVLLRLTLHFFACVTVPQKTSCEVQLGALDDTKSKSLFVHSSDPTLLSFQNGYERQSRFHRPSAIGSDEPFGLCENPVSVSAKDGELFVKEIQSTRTTDPHIGTGRQETRSQFAITQRKRTCRKLVHLGHVEFRHFRKKVFAMRRSH